MLAGRLTVFGGEERGFGAGQVLGSGCHQLDGPDLLVCQLPETGLSVLEHSTHCHHLLVSHVYLILWEQRQCENRDN